MLLFKIQTDVYLSLFHILKVMWINFLLLRDCIYVETVELLVSESYSTVIA